MMSLVKYDDRRPKQPWSKRDQRATRHQIPDVVEKPVIDYDKLRSLCAIDGLQDRTNHGTTEEAHKEFMKKYHSMFVQPGKRTGRPDHVATRRDHQASQVSLLSGSGTEANSKSVVAGESTLDHKSKTKQKPSEAESDPSHNIRDHMVLLHKERRSFEPEALLAQRLKTMRKILRKLPFERSAEENEQLYGAVKHFSTLSGQVAPNVLKELCVAAQLDSWKDDDITLFGNTGLHLIIKGSVRPNTLPYMKHRGVRVDFPSATPEPEFEFPTLGVGECFGTLEKVEGRGPNSRILTVTTLEPNCEFFKIGTSDYQRVTEQIRTREQTEKISLMQSCSTYKLWSKQPLIYVADLFHWVDFPPNTVLVSEGYQAPFIAIIKSGECHVLRKVDAMHQLANGRKTRRDKQVVMGKLGASASFGEVSLIGDEPMTCSIVTATDVVIACIEATSLSSLDETTQQLLLQSSERTYADLTQDDIHNEYVQQELKQEWNQFKHNVVVEAINAKGVRPGYGKWAKN